jgi:hypothetical protein
MGIEVIPAAVDFGAVDIGEAAVREVTLINRSGTTLQIDEIAASSARFDVDFAGATLQPREELVVAVTFRPTADAPASGERGVWAGDADGARVAMWGNDCERGLADAWDVDRDGFSACATDCDDSDPDARPGGVEAPDGVDNDCDGLVDEGTASVDRAVAIIIDAVTAIFGDGSAGLGF